MSGAAEGLLGGERREGGREGGKEGRKEGGQRKSEQGVNGSCLKLQVDGTEGEAGETPLAGVRPTLT